MTGRLRVRSVSTRSVLNKTRAKTSSPSMGRKSNMTMKTIKKGGVLHPTSSLSHAVDSSNHYQHSNLSTYPTSHPNSPTTMLSVQSSTQTPTASAQSSTVPKGPNVAWKAYPTDGVHQYFSDFFAYEWNYASFVIVTRGQGLEAWEESLILLKNHHWTENYVKNICELCLAEPRVYMFDPTTLDEVREEDAAEEGAREGTGKGTEANNDDDGEDVDYEDGENEESDNVGSSSSTVSSMFILAST